MTMNERLGIGRAWRRSVTLVPALLLSVFPGGCHPREAKDPLTQDSIDAGDRHFADKDYSEALADYRRADDEEPGVVSADRWTRLGDQFASYKDPDGADLTAMEAYRRAHARDPKREGIRLRQVLLLLRSSPPRREKALVLLREEEALRPGRDDVRKVREGLEAEIAKSANERATAAATQEQDEVQRERLRAESERLEAERVSRLRAQSAEIAGLQCRLEGYRVFGKDFGGELTSAVAAGTFVGVLVQCVNKTRATAYFPTRSFAIVDAKGRAFSIDTRGSFQLAVWKSDQQIRNPEALQLHPGSPTFVQLMFDLAPEIAEAPTTRLAFANKMFQLVFTDEGKSTHGDTSSDSNANVLGQPGF